tara:strand:+ start:781 stop:1044 length:264 start_codon:yes stop_codon:yes gene_type:complete
MFDQSNRVKITVGVLLAAYSLGASQGAIKSKITEHFDSVAAIKSDLEAVKSHVAVNADDIETLESSARSNSKQIQYIIREIKPQRAF